MLPQIHVREYQETTAPGSGEEGDEVEAARVAFAADHNSSTAALPKARRTRSPRRRTRRSEASLAKRRRFFCCRCGCTFASSTNGGTPFQPRSATGTYSVEEESAAGEGVATDGLFEEALGADDALTSKSSTERQSPLRTAQTPGPRSAQSRARLDAREAMQKAPIAPLAPSTHATGRDEELAMSPRQQEVQTRGTNPTHVQARRIRLDAAAR